MIERWVECYEYPDYEVSDQGRVRCKVDRRQKKAGDLLAVWSKPDWYASTMLWRDGKEKNISVHRLVIQSFNGPIPEGLVVNHKNGIKNDNRLDNLEVVTNQYNVWHGVHVLKTSSPKWPVHKGEAQHKAVLTEQDVRDIRTRYAAGGTSYRKLADKYGVDPTTIAAVVKRTSWKHVK